MRATFASGANWQARGRARRRAFGADQVRELSTQYVLDEQNEKWCIVPFVASAGSMPQIMMVSLPSGQTYGPYTPQPNFEFRHVGLDVDAPVLPVTHDIDAGMPTKCYTGTVTPSGPGLVQCNSRDGGFCDEPVRPDAGAAVFLGSATHTPFSGTVEDPNNPTGCALASIGDTSQNGTITWNPGTCSSISTAIALENHVVRDQTCPLTSTFVLPAVGGASSDYLRGMAGAVSSPPNEDDPFLNWTAFYFADHAARYFEDDLGSNVFHPIRFRVEELTSCPGHSCYGSFHLCPFFHRIAILREELATSATGRTSKDVIGTIFHEYTHSVEDRSGVFASTCFSEGALAARLGVSIATLATLPLAGPWIAESEAFSEGAAQYFASSISEGQADPFARFSPFDNTLANGFTNVLVYPDDWLGPSHWVSIADPCAVHQNGDFWAQYYFALRDRIGRYEADKAILASFWILGSGNSNIRLVDNLVAGPSCYDAINEYFDAHNPAFKGENAHAILGNRFNPIQSLGFVAGSPSQLSLQTRADKGIRPSFDVADSDRDAPTLWVSNAVDWNFWPETVTGGDVDFFRVDLAEGVPYFVQLRDLSVRNGGTPLVWLRVEDSAHTTLVSKVSSAGFTVFTPTHSGPHYVSIRSVVPWLSVDYSIAVNDLFENPVPRSAGVPLPGTPPPGRFNLGVYGINGSSDDVDNYTFVVPTAPGSTTTVKAKIQVALSSQVPPPDSIDVLRWDPSCKADGQCGLFCASEYSVTGVADCTAGGIFCRSVDLPSGTYTARLRWKSNGPGSYGFGQYLVNVTVNSSEALDINGLNGGRSYRLEIGRPIADSIGGNSLPSTPPRVDKQDVFVFNAVADGHYVINFRERSAGCDLTARVRYSAGPDGALASAVTSTIRKRDLFFDDSSGEFVNPNVHFVAPSAGDFEVVVENPGDSECRYWIEVDKSPHDEPHAPSYR